VSERSDEERFDPERLRRLQWDGDADDVPELAATAAQGAAAQATRDVEHASPSVSEETVLIAGDDSMDAAAENVFEAWPVSAEHAVPGDAARAAPEPSEAAHLLAGEPEPLQPEPLQPESLQPGPGHAEPVAPEPELPRPVEQPVEHVPGVLAIPPGYAVLEGEARGERRTVGVVVSRFNGDVTSRLLASALDELGRRGVAEEAITVMPVPGAFELPLAAMALAKTRRFACIVALGCVVRGETPHFDYVASEAASGLQLAAIETGVPVAFGVLTLETTEQAEARVAKGAEAAVTALEMADAFANLRAAASR
jgi:6,7-dimethyl-8-ribityllumazine synthase